MNRARVAAKLIGFSLASLAIVWIRDIAQLAAAASIVALVAAWTGVRHALPGRELRAIAIMVSLSLAFNLLFVPTEAALLLAGRLTLVLVLAVCFSASTPSSAVLDTVMVALRPVLGDRRAERFALAVALVTRFVPVMSELARDVQEARVARGAGRSVRAFAVPLVIRSLKQADELGDALVARGAADA